MYITMAASETHTDAKPNVHDIHTHTHTHVIRPVVAPPI